MRESLSFASSHTLTLNFGFWQNTYLNDLVEQLFEDQGLMEPRTNWEFHWHDTAILGTLVLRSFDFGGSNQLYST